MYLQKQTPIAPQQTNEFAAIRQHVKQLHSNWDAFYEEFSRLESPYADEFRRHNQHFSQAVDKILTALETPTLTLATTGTTSSGKSTLVNLLCGADIMPRMAGEMSAGIVTIKHASDGKRLLKIEKTPNAVWECGEWKDLSDYDIRNRLTKTMDAFNEAKQKRELPSPVIELTYPIACFFPKAGLLNLSDLPARTQFQIMDLPGKRNQDDKINSAVIQNCSRALSIVTYDMAQTDEKLRQKLIEEVLEQVKLMGGSPARMLFALNRIDVFRKDREWERREQESAEKTIKEIKHILHERLPEHRGVLEHLSYSKLSGLPALLAWQMQSNQKDLQEYASEQIEDHFKFLIPRVVKADLSNNSWYHWNENDFLKVRNSLWESTYAKDFFSMLEKHIRENFAKLIAAPLLVEFEMITSDIIVKSANLCGITIKSFSKKYQDVTNKLYIDKQKIEVELDKIYNDLMSPQKIIKDRGLCGLDYLYNDKALEDSKIYNDSSIEKLWREVLKSIIKEPISWSIGVSEGATQSLKAGQISFSGTKADDLSHEHSRKLEKICKQMFSNYHIEIAKNGKEVKAAWKNEKKELDNLLECIGFYIEDLSELMAKVHEEKTKNENRRLEELVEKILNVYLKNLKAFIESNQLDLVLEFKCGNFDEVKINMPRIEFEPVIKKKAQYVFQGLDFPTLQTSSATVKSALCQ